jgi:pantoate--beta-alanine ligase
MGQKDYQQYLIVKKMIKTLKMKTKLIVCPTIREADGLAMSSRNVLLNIKERQAAADIPKTLFAAKNKIHDVSFTELQKQSIERLNKNPLLKTEYFEIADAVTLKPVKQINVNSSIVICTAVKVGSVRLIDNIVIS